MRRMAINFTEKNFNRIIQYEPVRLTELGMLMSKTIVDKIIRLEANRLLKTKLQQMYKVSGLLAVCIFLFASCNAESKPRVFVFTDINIDSGDPDDRQSLVHLLWYADELQIEGVVPDRWNARGLEACQLVLEAYARDYSQYSFSNKGYPEPNDIRNKIAKDVDQASRLFSLAASDQESPLYVLIWGNMELFKTLLSERPAYADNIRLITIGTGLMLEKDIEHIPANWEKSQPCQQLNWNGFGRNEIYNNPHYKEMWWLEMNWTYAGMFVGEEPRRMFDKLALFGTMGKHIKEVVKNEDWAQYFRVGDTPSVLYLIDDGHDLNNPTQSSWAGKFAQPFPTERPNYFTDFSGSLEWNYLNPCATWQNHQNVRNVAAGTLGDRRPEMYSALIRKLELIYKDQ